MYLSHKIIIIIIIAGIYRVHLLIISMHFTYIHNMKIDTKILVLKYNR